MPLRSWSPDACICEEDCPCQIWDEECCFHYAPDNCPCNCDDSLAERWEKGEDRKVGQP